MKFEPEAAWYVGIPRAGKTRLAVSHAVVAARETGWPVLAIDSQGVSNFKGWPHARTAAAAIESVWGQRSTVAFMPNDAGDMEQIIQATLRAGRVHLLVDEAAYWLDSRRGRGGSMLRILRTFRHLPAHVLLTTQHLSGDVPQEALSCAPSLYVFRCTAPAVLDRLEREYAVPRATVANLEQGRFLTIRSGF